MPLCLGEPGCTSWISVCSVFPTDPSLGSRAPRFSVRHPLVSYCIPLQCLSHTPTEVNLIFPIIPLSHLGSPNPKLSFLNFAFKCSRPTIALELSTAESLGKDRDAYGCWDKLLSVFHHFICSLKLISLMALFL